MIFKSQIFTTGSFLYTTVLPIYLNRKFLGTPLSAKRRNLIFRLKFVEKAFFDIELNSISTQQKQDKASVDLQLNSSYSTGLFTEIISNTNNLTLIKYDTVNIDKTEVDQSLNNSEYKFYKNNSVEYENLQTSKYEPPLIDKTTQYGNLNNSKYETPLIDKTDVFLKLEDSKYSKPLIDNSNLQIGYESKYFKSEIDHGDISVTFESDYYETEKDIGSLNIAIKEQTYFTSKQDLTTNISVLNHSDYKYNSLDEIVSSFNFNKINYNLYSDNDKTSQIFILNNSKYFYDKLETTSHNIQFTNLDYKIGSFFGKVTQSFDFTNLSYLLERNYNKLTHSLDLTNLDYKLGLNTYKAYHNLNLIGSRYKVDEFKQSFNFNLNLIKNVYDNKTNYAKTHLTNNLKQARYDKNTLYDDAQISKVGVRPGVSNASNVTYNGDSLVNYVDTIQVITYMTGSVITQSIIDYENPIFLYVIGNSNQGTYLTNFDYDRPYRASFTIKNWPYYSLSKPGQTKYYGAVSSSLWRLPVILNASNDEISGIQASMGVWVEALAENNTTLTDQYGYAIDI